MTFPRAAVEVTKGYNHGCELRKLGYNHYIIITYYNYGEKYPVITAVPRYMFGGLLVIWLMIQALRVVQGLTGHGGVHASKHGIWLMAIHPVLGIHIPYIYIYICIYICVIIYIYIDGPKVRMRVWKKIRKFTGGYVILTALDASF